MSRVRVLAAAKTDIDELAEYLAREADVAVGHRFLECVAATLDLLSRFPMSGAEGRYRAKALAGVRRITVLGFDKYIVFYRTGSREVRVLRILHGARDIESRFTDE